jgi:DinB superfamily
MTTHAEIKPRATPGVAAAGAALLEQCAALLREVPDEAYAADSRVLAGGTIGKHVRHCLDHYRAAIEGRSSGEPVDYDHRQRGGEVETKRDAAIEAIGDLRTRLLGVRGEHLAEPMKVRFMIAGDGAQATFDTTFGREIAFAGHHAIHHFAMVKAIAAEHGVACPSDFGKAPSTINYESTRA